MDATAIDAPDGYFDIAVFALSLHHLPPPVAARVFTEGTRAANKLLISIWLGRLLYCTSCGWRRGCRSPRYFRSRTTV